MEPRRHRQSSSRSLRLLLHSIWLRGLGFAWVMMASLFLVFGAGLAMLGIAGGLLVRVRPDTSHVINYDPSTVAIFSPLPVVIGLLLLLAFVKRTRELGR